MRIVDLSHTIEELPLEWCFGPASWSTLGRTATVSLAVTPRR
jgi:hypothetical protein